MPRYFRRSYPRSVLVLWIVVLVAVGLVRRFVDTVLAAPAGEPLKLAVPLGELPKVIGAWSGVDVPVDKRVIKVAGTDDHVYRRYVDESNGSSVYLYAGYTSRPVSMLGHRPDICYPANGWIMRSSREESVVLANGSRVPCLIHQFEEGESGAPLVVLNYYVLQGRHTAEWSDFWGPKWRRPNLSRDPSYYVAQVQIAGGAMIPGMYARAESAVREFAALAVPQIDSLLPKANTAASSE